MTDRRTVALLFLTGVTVLLACAYWFEAVLP
jgi:hypothetical protein